MRAEQRVVDRRHMSVRPSVSVFFIIRAIKLALAVLHPRVFAVPNYHR